MKRFRIILLLVVISLINSFQSKGQNSTQARAYYLSAETSYENKNYEDALSMLEKSVEAGGGTNAYIESLRIKIFHDQKRWMDAKRSLDRVYSMSVDNETLKDISPYIINVEKEYERAKNEEEARIAKAKAEEEDRKKKEEAQRLAKIDEERFFNEKAKELKPIIENQLDFFLKNSLSGTPTSKGPVFLINNHLHLTTSQQEKAYLMIGLNRYIIYTVPESSIINNLEKESTIFKSVDANRFSRTLLTFEEIKSNSGKYYHLTFRQSDKFNNVYIGGLGDELIWSGEQYTQFKQTLYYYFVGNTFRADINMYNESYINEEYYNPYVEVGDLEKTIDFRLVKDEELKTRLIRLGFKDKPSTDRNNLNLLSVETRPSNQINMIFACKEIDYILDSTLSGKFLLNNESYKGTAGLYFKPKSFSSHYGYVVFKLNTKRINIFKDISKTDTEILYAGFDVAQGAFKENSSGSVLTFTSPDFKVPIGLGKTIKDAKVVQYSNNQ